MKSQIDRDALGTLRTEIESCVKCPRLVAWREDVAANPRASFAEETYWGRPVGGFGDPDARLVIVGLAPAAHGANRTGRVFTGDRSGDWLYAGLFRAGFANQPTSVARDDGLTLEDAWVSAAVRCAPPQNKPLPIERENCAPYLVRELALLANATVLIALGKFASDALGAMYAVRPLPEFAHLAESELPDGRVLLCSYHPSQQNTFTGKLTKPMFDAVFARAREILDHSS